MKKILLTAILSTLVLQAQANEVDMSADLELNAPVSMMEGYDVQDENGVWHETNFVARPHRPGRPGYGPGRPHRPGRPGYPGRPGRNEIYSCSTQSNRQMFRATVWADNRFEAEREIARICSRSYRTDSRECNRNARCW